MRLSTLCLAALSVFALSSSAAQAATPRGLSSCDGARVDKAAGVARTLTDCGQVDLGRGAEGAARQALGRVSRALGVRSDTGDLSLMRADATVAGPRVRFQQFVEGVPVRNGQVTVALDKAGSVILVGSGASPASTLAAARVSRAEALLTARRRVGSGFDTRSAPTAELVAEPTPDGRLEPAWHVVLPTRAPLGDWNVLVSARTGAVLKAYDGIVRANTAQTYSPNPVQMTGTTALRDVSDSDQATLTAARALLPLTDLDSGTPLVRGTFANAAPTSGVSGCTLPYNPGQASSATHDYNNTRAQDAFEEPQAYLAVTRVQKTYAALGFPGIFTAPVPIDVHCVPDDNSFFSTSDDALHMGDGGVDDAEDSDVTVHEFGHATQAAQVPGFGPGGPDTEQRAMGEGFGDFLATYIYLQDGNAAYQGARRFCVMEWDATAYNPVTAGNPGSGCLRWVDGTDEGDGSDIGFYRGTPSEEHDDGRYWSAMLTCVFEGIDPSLGTTQARDRMLTLVLAHHQDLVPTDENTAFADSLDALRAEDQARFNGDEVALIRQCGELRLGIGTAPLVTGSLTPANPDGANGWYRTAPAVGWSVTDPETAVRRSGCQEGTDTADTPGKTIACTGTSAGGSTARSLTYRKDSTPPTLAARLSAAPVVGRAVTATPNAADATSGVASQSCATPDTATAGPHTFTCTATDAAGNQATQAFAYTVAAAPPRATTFKRSKVRLARNGDISFRLTASRSVRVKITAKAGKVKFRSLNKRLTKGKAIKVTLKLSKKARRAFKRQLRKGKTVKVKVTLKPIGEKRLTMTLRVRRSRTT